jgi:hypothetical protein
MDGLTCIFQQSPLSSHCDSTPFFPLLVWGTCGNDLKWIEHLMVTSYYKSLKTLIFLGKTYKHV